MSLSSQIQILGVAFDAKSSFMGGAGQAPARIREELRSSAYNSYSEAMIDVLHPPISAFGPILRPKAYEDIYPQVKRAFNATARPVFLGGDHSISYPIMQLMHETYGKLHILHFDAHGDLYDVLDGDRYSHACPFARILEDDLALSLTQVGIRTMSPHQAAQAAKFDVDVITMNNLSRFDPAALQGPLYISIDMDVFDPGFAPGVSHRESGGIDPRTLISWLQALEQPIAGADIVEFNPLRDVSDLTAALCYKLVKEVVDAMVNSPVV